MTWGQIQQIIEKDLGIPAKRAYNFTKMFKKEFKGFKESIKDIKASYTDDGYVCIEYQINKNTRSLIIKKEN